MLELILITDRNVAIKHRDFCITHGRSSEYYQGKIDAINQALKDLDTCKTKKKS